MGAEMVLFISHICGNLVTQNLLPNYFNIFPIPFQIISFLGVSFAPGWPKLLIVLTVFFSVFLSGRLDALGFTLIELLVVVLIIGILAAIALPQYQKAAERAKASEAIVILKSVAQAVHYYHLANGTWPASFDELSVEVPWTGNENGYTGGYGLGARSNKDWSLQLYQSSTEKRIYLTRLHHPRYQGVTFIYSFQDAQMPTGEIVCFERKSTGVIFPGSTGSYCQKIMHGESIGGSYPQFYHNLF